MEQEYEGVIVEFDKEWNARNRIKKLIEGAELSVDEIIKSLFNPMDLENLKDERYKAATSGREDAIDTASAIIKNIDRMRKNLNSMDDDGLLSDDRGKTISSFAERNASESSI